MTLHTRLPHLDQFLRGEASRKAPSTVRNHRAALLRFGHWLQNQNGATAASASPLQLDAYACDLRESYPASANSHISAVRLFERWLWEMGLRGDDPSRALRFIAAQAPRIEPLSIEEIRLLLSVASRPRLRFGVVRTAYLVGFLCDSGLRIGEALGLNMGDLDLAAGRLMVRAPKTHSIRVLPVSPALRDVLSAYLDRRALQLTARGVADGPLWCGEHGGRWSVSAAEQSCRTVARLAGLQRRFHPHLCRHSCGSLLAANGAPINIIMAVLGHDRVSTTMRYMQTTSEQMAEAVAAASPLARVQVTDRA